MCTSPVARALENLEEIRLRGNKLSTIEFGPNCYSVPWPALIELAVVDVSENEILANISDFLARMPPSNLRKCLGTKYEAPVGLRVLNFAKNRFSGEIDVKNPFGWRTVEELYGAHNNISGPVPWIGEPIRIVDFEHNEFTRFDNWESTLDTPTLQRFNIKNN